MTIQVKATEHYFLVVLFIMLYKMVKVKAFKQFLSVLLLIRLYKVHVVVLIIISCSVS